MCCQFWHTHFDHILNFIVMFINANGRIPGSVFSSSLKATLTFSPFTERVPQMPQIGHSTLVVPVTLKRLLWQTGHTPSSPSQVFTSSYGFPRDCATAVPSFEHFPSAPGQVMGGRYAPGHKHPHDPRISCKGRS